MEDPLLIRQKSNSNKKKNPNKNLYEYPIKLLTYNIFLRPPLIKNNADDYKNERTKFFLNEIIDFEIICL